MIAPIAGLQTIVVGGSVVGGYGELSGAISCLIGEIIHLLKIDGDVRGSVGNDSGSITDTGGVTPSIGGEVFAGSGIGSGVITT